MLAYLVFVFLDLIEKEIVALCFLLGQLLLNDVLADNDNSLL